MSQLIQVAKFLKEISDLSKRIDEIKWKIEENYEKVNEEFQKFLSKLPPLAKKEGYNVGIYDGSAYRNLSSYLQRKLNLITSPHSTIYLNFSLQEKKGSINCELSFHGYIGSINVWLFPLTENREYFKEDENRVVCWNVDVNSFEKSLQGYLKKYKEEFIKA